MFASPHRRYNLLTDEWILVSPHRTQRPWQGRQEEVSLSGRPTYDATCYLCPGNSRTSGQRNPNFEGTFVFDNDFPALLSDIPAKQMNKQDLLIAKAEQGVCRVVCFSPRHDLSLPQLDREAIRQVIEVWTRQYLQLAEFPWINHVQIFENKGATMGASNPHPHCQIWASSSVPVELAKELNACTRYMKTKKSCLLCDYLQLEFEHNERLVISNASFAVVVPFWATWPFETLLLPRRHVADLSELTSHERGELADILKRLTIHYDNLFQTDFPYSMGFHQRPTDDRAYPEFHFHAHFYPPLLRSANVRKFMVGYEMLSEPQRDITPEAATRQLRRLPEEYYRSKSNNQNSDHIP
jgi:UDPglucose--hexose-1-phosphate uridylyltransferase